MDGTLTDTPKGVTDQTSGKEANLSVSKEHSSHRQDSELDSSWDAVRTSEMGSFSSPKDALVSVVIPIYNVEEYLEECLDSVLSQTHENIEVICVNDGSTDSSPEIVRRYEASDSRIKVIDKPNGGYGHSVNRGISEASGEWIAIVEPDDFVSPYMYENLLGNAVMKDGTLADVVKGSFWLYYDPKDGGDPSIETPRLTTMMPKHCTEWDVYSDPSILRYHPSIWSAIYRKAFLEHFGIRMVEPPGAGWTDNPWLYETLLCAHAVVWVPEGLYYYRKTNPNASTFLLRDYHLPFDRLRDIREIYRRKGISDKGLLASLYHRSFFYIFTRILENPLFDESDEELQALIRETLESMDEDIVLGMPDKVIAKRFKDYYLSFLGKGATLIEEHTATENLLISIVVPLRDDREKILTTVSTLQAQSYDEFEVLFCDCGSRDSSLRIAKDAATRDGRFLVLDGHEKGLGQAIDAAAAAARGAWVYVLRAGITLDTGALGNLAAALSSAELAGCEMALLAKSYPSAVLKSAMTAHKDAWGVLPAEGNRVLIAAAAPMDASARAYRRTLLTSERIGHVSEEDLNGYVLGMRCLLKAERVGFVSGVTVRPTGRFDYDHKRLATERETIEFEKAQIEAIAAEAGLDEQTEARALARLCVASCLGKALDYVGRYEAHGDFFDCLRHVYRTTLGLSHCSGRELGNYELAQRLEAAFGNTYEYFLRTSYEKVFNGRRTALRQRNAARKDVKRLEETNKSQERLLSRTESELSTARNRIEELQASPLYKAGHKLSRIVHKAK